MARTSSPGATLRSSRTSLSRRTLYLSSTLRTANLPTFSLCYPPLKVSSPTTSARLIPSFDLSWLVIMSTYKTIESRRLVVLRLLMILSDECCRERVRGRVHGHYRCDSRDSLVLCLLRRRESLQRATMLQPEP